MSNFLMACYNFGAHKTKHLKNKQIVVVVGFVYFLIARLCLDRTGLIQKWELPS